MEQIENRVDTRISTPQEMENAQQQTRLLFRFNHAAPLTEEYKNIMCELFHGGIGERSFITAPLQGVCFDRIRIGRHVFINSNLLAMARGGITMRRRKSSMPLKKCRN